MNKETKKYNPSKISKKFTIFTYCLFVCLKQPVLFVEQVSNTNSSSKKQIDNTRISFLSQEKFVQHKSGLTPIFHFRVPCFEAGFTFLNAQRYITLFTDYVCSWHIRHFWTALFGDVFIVAFVLLRYSFATNFADQIFVSKNRYVNPNIAQSRLIGVYGSWTANVMTCTYSTNQVIYKICSEFHWLV